MSKQAPCADCVYLSEQTKHGEFIGFSCRGDPNKPGRRWPISVALKPNRCGGKQAWRISAEEVRREAIRQSSGIKSKSTTIGEFA